VQASAGGQAVPGTATAAPTSTETAALPENTSALELPLPEIRRFEDTDPGPPFTMRVSHIFPGKDRFKLTGWVRNDGSETYEGIGVVGTLFNDTGWWLGAVDAHCPCLFLEPGAECPFSLETYPGDYVAYRLHPEGRAVEYRQPASLVLSDLNLTDDGIGNLRVTGKAINRNEFAVENAIVAGMLIDANGHIVSLGSTFVRGDIVPGVAVAFDLRIKHEPYAHYQLYVQAVRN
jgi:hypothetical protein